MNERKTLYHVDGSYSPKSLTPTKAGWGVAVIEEEVTDKETNIVTIKSLSGKVLHHGMNQVAGELTAVYHALREGIFREEKQIVICYDYSGVELWATRKWKAKNDITIRYQNLFKIDKERILYGHENDQYMAEVIFRKITAKENRADALATAAIGIKSVH